MLSVLSHCIPGRFVTQQVRTDTGETLLYETQEFLKDGNHILLIFIPSVPKVTQHILAECLLVWAALKRANNHHPANDCYLTPSIKELPAACCHLRSSL